MAKIGSYEKGWWRNLKVWLALAFVAIAIFLTAILFLFSDQIQNLEGYGYAGAFAIGVMESAIIIVPFPNIVLIFALGGLLNPFIVGLAVGIGETVGSLSLYLAGRGGSVIFYHGGWSKLYDRLQDWMKKRGTIVLFILSAIINPFFYPAGIAAGALKFPLWRYVLIIWIGKTIKGIIVAGAGALGLGWWLGG